MHVRISDKGRIIMNDSRLSGKVVKAIIKYGQKLSKGKSIIVSGIEISFVK